MNFNEDIQYNLNFDNSNEIEPVIKEFDNKKKLINSTLDKWVLKKERPDTWLLNYIFIKKALLTKRVDI